MFGFFKQKLIDSEMQACEDKASFNHKSKCYFITLYDPKSDDCYNTFNINFMLECLEFMQKDVPTNTPQIVMVDGHKVQYMKDPSGKIHVKTLERDDLDDYIESLQNYEY